MTKNHGKPKEFLLKNWKDTCQLAALVARCICSLFLPICAHLERRGAHQMSGKSDILGSCHCTSWHCTAHCTLNCTTATLNHMAFYKRALRCFVATIPKTNCNASYCKKLCWATFIWKCFSSSCSMNIDHWSWSRNFLHFFMMSTTIASKKRKLGSLLTSSKGFTYWWVILIQICRCANWQDVFRRKQMWWTGIFFH